MYLDFIIYSVNEVEFYVPQNAITLFVFHLNNDECYSLKLALKSLPALVVMTIIMKMIMITRVSPQAHHFRFDLRDCILYDGQLRD